MAFRWYIVHAYSNFENKVAQSLRDQVEVVVVNPNRREVIGHAKRHRITRAFEAHDGFEPHLENIFRKERLKVAFHGFPEAGRERQRRHGSRLGDDFIHTVPPSAFRHVRTGLIHVSPLQRK